MKNILTSGGHPPNPAEGYQYMWDELEGAQGDIPGDDILFYGSSFGPFHNNSELESKIFALESHFPDIFEVFTIGETYFDRPIYGVKVTDKVSFGEKSEILYMAQQHAREQITREGALFFLDSIANRSLEPTNGIWKILNEKEIYVIPSLNLDGVSILHNNPWMRKTLPKIDEDSTYYIDGYIGTMNLMEPQDLNGDGYIDEFYEVIKSEEYRLEGYEGVDINGDGVVGDNLLGGIDPNRNFDYDFANPDFASHYPSSQAYHGGTPYSEIIVEHLSMFVNNHKFEVILDIHSGIRLLFLPDLGDTDKGKEQESQFQNITRGIYDLTKIPYQENPYSGGMFIPWAYNTRSDIVYAAIYEVYGNKSALSVVANENTSIVKQRGIWDMFNPPANEILPVCEEVANVLEYLAGLNLIIEKNLPEYIFLIPIFIIGTIFISLHQKLRRKKSSLPSVDKIH